MKAKELGWTSKQTIDLLRARGEYVTSPHNTLAEIVARDIRREFAVTQRTSDTADDVLDPNMYGHAVAAMPNHHIAEGETWAQALRRAQAESRSSSNGRDRQPLPAVVRALLDGVVGAASWRARCYARRPAATVAVNDLEKRRLVVRRTNPDNRRCKIVSMTVAGRDVVGALEAIDDPAPAGLAALNDDDLTVQLDVMNRLAEQLTDLVARRN